MKTLTRIKLYPNRKDLAIVGFSTAIQVPGMGAEIAIVGPTWEHVLNAANRLLVGTSAAPINRDMILPVAMIKAAHPALLTPTANKKLASLVRFKKI